MNSFKTFSRFIKVAVTFISLSYEYEANLSVLILSDEHDGLCLWVAVNCGMAPPGYRCVCDDWSNHHSVWFQNYQRYINKLLTNIIVWMNIIWNVIVSHIHEVWSTFQLNLAKNRPFRKEETHMWSDQPKFVYFFVPGLSEIYDTTIINQRNATNPVKSSEMWTD